MDKTSGNSLAETIEKIARVCHEANRAYCFTLGDTSQQPWDEAEEWQRSSSRSGVAGVLKGEIQSPGDSHRSWLRQKEQEGWMFGYVKDPVLKTHPSMVPFEQLPHSEQLKDYLFLSVVRALDPFADMPSGIRWPERSPIESSRL